MKETFMWRDSARRPGVLGIDGASLFPILIWLVHWSWATLYIAVAGVGWFWFLARRGYRPVVMLRAIRVRLTGRRRTRRFAVVMRDRMWSTSPYAHPGNLFR